MISRTSPLCVFSFILAFVAAFACNESQIDTPTESQEKQDSLNYNVFCFYYPWYGSEEHDGQNFHWSASYYTEKGASRAGVHTSEHHDISSCFYPEAGMYSSADRATIIRQLKDMAECGIGVVIAEWGYSVNSDNAPDEEKVLPVIFDVADSLGMKVSVIQGHYAGRTVSSTRTDIVNYVHKYGRHNACWKIDGRPVYLIWSTNNTGDDPEKKDEFFRTWDKLLTKDGSISIRGTAYDAFVVTILKNMYNKPDIVRAGFDGFYTYFAVDGLTECATTANWKSLLEWADSKGLVFMPSIGPGYEDTRLNCWNTSSTRNRNGGQYYRDMASAAFDAKVRYLGITSYNEWHEGTQIEPAIPMSVDKDAKTDYGPYIYKDYTPESPDFYLRLTKEIIQSFNKQQ